MDLFRNKIIIIINVVKIYVDEVGGEEMGSSSIRWVDMSKGEIEGWEEEERERSTIREKVWGGELNTAALSQPAVLLFCLVGL